MNANESSASTYGRVVFIGAGPGAADLITVRGAQRLAEANVVLFDALTDPALRAMAPRARWVNVGKRGFSDSAGQATINAMLVKFAATHRVVVRLKGGDPSVFGRLEEELQALAHFGIASEVVPGVTAAMAAAASTQRPLTRRGNGRSVSLTTAMTAMTAIPAGGPSRTEAVASTGTGMDAGTDTGTGGAAQAHAEMSVPRHADTEVFYMAGKQLAALSRRLVSSGWTQDEAVSVVSRAGWPDQLHSDHTVSTLARASLLHAGRPTVVTVGAGARPVVGTAPRAEMSEARIQGREIHPWPAGSLNP